MQTLEKTVSTPVIVRASKPWSECPTARPFIDKGIARMIDSLDYHNYQSDGAAIKERLDRYLHEGIIDESHYEKLTSDLGSRMGEYALLKQHHFNVEEGRRLQSLANKMAAEIARGF